MTRTVKVGRGAFISIEYDPQNNTLDLHDHQGVMVRYLEVPQVEFEKILLIIESRTNLDLYVKDHLGTAGYPSVWRP